MKKPVILILAIILLSMCSIVQRGNGVIQIPTKVFINTTYLGDNNTWGLGDVLVNITINRLGHLKYIEEYFTVDSGGNPKFITSRTYYDNDITDNNISFLILRPFSRSGKFYNMIRGVVMIDNKRIKEKWIRTISGVHLTYSEEDITTKINDNIDKFETEDNTLIANLPITYKFKTPDIAIYEVDITSIGNEHYVELRIKSFKDVPIFVKRFPGAVYKYLDVSLDTRQVKQVFIRYKVENSWINNNDISGEKIKLFRWNKTNDKWYESTTRIISKDDNYTYYESDTVNISQSAIAGLRNNAIIINQTTNSINFLNLSTKKNTIVPIPVSTTTKEVKPKITEILMIETTKNILYRIKEFVIYYVG